MNAEHDDNGAELVREQAATWIARLEGGVPSAEARAEFEAWLSADPRRELVYRRMARRFDNARVLRGSSAFAPAAKRTSRRFIPGIVGAAIAATVAFVVAVPLYQSWTREPSLPPHEQSIASRNALAQTHRQQIATSGGELRSVGLADGSTVTLDGATTVMVDFTPAARTLTLLRGRARFSVAHSSRPFIVKAGSGSVVARGTLFDVSIAAGGRVDVVLIRGTIDVTPSIASHSTAPVRLSPLTDGEAIAFAAGELAPPATRPPTEANWADRVDNFDNVPLAEVLDRANRRALKPIRLAEPDLGKLRVSGRFSITDPDRLANNLASLFGLRVEAHQDAVLLARD